ncbi:sugar ABC transporter ATP-binding protein [Streptomyces coeruleorubidus]|uniref:sugar ABC transporter ATP-binding protein n=1 Tax=Streptomyces coeruleorubidus TaxID=116188 RepID=UPI00237FCC36|nr:sugar ABC transporter ATP-binding protein [Streptomyces coeruleorubidus]WDV52388.1 sugar ABC transporter ATP-binding protein [Streptomyces coeruleorubidus]
MAEPRPVLEMTGVVKEFPGVKALSGVDFRLFPGEIHALMGENGAGKSTLIKVLTGVYSLDGGTIVLDGESVRFGSPLQAQQAGISTVYQEVNLCPNLSVAENIFIGREPTRAGRIQWKRMRKEAEELVDRLGLDIDVAAPLSSYPLAVQQLVAIVRSVGTGDRDAAGSGTKVLVLDEPTSSLDRDEVLELFRLMRQLRDEGVAILFVSHFLDQIYEVCDRMTVLRNGTLVGEHLVRDLDQVGLIELMIGKALDQLEELHEHQMHSDVGETLVKAEGLGRTGGIAPFDLEIKKGEVLGLAGLLGSGRTELARLLFGADQPDSGKVTVGGKQISMSAPNDAIAAGVAFCSENRKSEGLVPDLTVRENIILALQAARGWTRPIPASQRDELVAKYIKALDIRPADPEARVGRLSGGNQQKVLLARWLITQPQLLILDEPTRGIDVGAKAEIQKLVVSLSEDGMSVLYIAAELEEVLRLSHTIGVLRDRRLVARLTNGPEITTSKILETIASGEHQ